MLHASMHSDRLLH